MEIEYLEKQLVMTIGITQNNWELTKEMVENSLESFPGKPIIFNKKQEWKDYTTEEFDQKYLSEEKIIGMICNEPNIIIENNNVYADIILFKKYPENNLWKGKFDNWCIQLNDNKMAFNLVSIEVF
jgi:hypothetical protein